MEDCKACCKATQEQIDAIKKVLDLYTGAAVKGNSKVARRSAIPIQI